MKVIIYARQSGGDEEQSASVEQQLENCAALAAKEGFEVIGSFFDCNISGKPIRIWKTPIRFRGSIPFIRRGKPPSFGKTSRPVIEKALLRYSNRYRRRTMFWLMTPHV